MVSKKEHDAITRKLILKKEAADEEAKRLRDCYEEIANERDRLQRDVDAHRARERARMAREHAEQQRARREAERKDKRKRRQELSDGMLRLREAFEWSFDHQPGEAPVLHLSVQLDGDTYPIVRGVVDKLNAPPRDAEPGLRFYMPNDFCASAPSLRDLARGIRI